jgi:phosphohistidine phosphatase
MTKLGSVQIYLLRHGIAEDGGAGVPDSERALTPEGKKRLREVMKVAAHAGVSPSLILSSPYRRALETARIVADELGYKDEVLRTKALIPSASATDAWQEIRLHRDASSLLLVGHEPLFGLLAAYLLGTPETQIDFKKGALFAVDLPAAGARPRGVLKWMLTSRLAGG